MTPLCELALKYGTDKVKEHANGTGHNYTPFYYELLKDRKIQSVLEIGICSNKVYTGPSLRMWADFFPEAQIWGFDNCPWVMVNEGRIKSVLGDQSKYADLAKITGQEYDLIIDDGSHEPAHQILTANDLAPCLYAGGLYIIEDIRHGEKENVQAGLYWPSEVIEFNVESKPDDRIIMVRG